MTLAGGRQEMRASESISGEVATSSLSCRAPAWRPYLIRRTTAANRRQKLKPYKAERLELRAAEMRQENAGNIRKSLAQLKRTTKRDGGGE